MGRLTRSARAVARSIDDRLDEGLQPQSAATPSAAVTLDPVTVVATKTRERVSETLAPVGTVRSAGGG
jgi:hypothetical protein